VAVSAGLIAGVLSIVRLLLTNSAALSNLVWAEDGLFPLCVKAHNVVSCAIDPFAGYLLLLQRLVAWPISLFPLDTWPLATNVAAALLAAGTAVLAVLVLRANGCGVIASGFVGILPVVVPMMGFEAINATGSSYMLLMFVCALAICLPPQGKFHTALYAVGALVLALTIPSSAVLLLPLVFQAATKRIPIRSAAVIGVCLVAGLLTQGFVAVTAANPRHVDFTIEALRSWADTMPSALLTYWPGQTTLTVNGSFASASAAGWGNVGLITCVIVLLLGIVLITVGRSMIVNGVGLLLLVGLGLGAIPAAAGYANNRYFVLPALLWAAAALIALDRGVLGKRREWAMAIVIVALAVAWIPGLKASSFRATAVPEWRPMLEAARTQCANAPDGSGALTFTPTWPFPDAVFPGPTNNVVNCAVLLAD
jgi:hypothetical protein